MSLCPSQPCALSATTWSLRDGPGNPDKERRDEESDSTSEIFQSRSLSRRRPGSFRMTRRKGFNRESARILVDSRFDILEVPPERDTSGPLPKFSDLER
jgi:hypothetical protein